MGEKYGTSISFDNKKGEEMTTLHGESIEVGDKERGRNKIISYKFGDIITCDNVIARHTSR